MKIIPVALTLSLISSYAWADAFSSVPPPPVPSGISGQFYNWSGQWSIPSGAGSTGNIVGSGATVTGHAACWNNTSATAQIDCGINPLGTTGNGSSLTGLTWSQIGSTPTTLSGYGITNGATSGANSNITSLTGLTTPLSVSQGGNGTATPTLTAGTNISLSGSWPNYTINSTGGGGGVSTVSVTSANGFAGSVANPGTTPAITISTSITGIVKGNGTSISAATAGTDYLAPAGSGAALTGLTWSQIGSTPTTLAGYGITNGATSGTNSNITSLTGLTTPLTAAQGGTGAVSLTAALDSAFGSTQGNVLYRSATGWVVLAPGTAGQFLQTGGTGANPAWATPATGSTVVEPTATYTTTGTAAGGATDRFALVNCSSACTITVPNGTSVARLNYHNIGAGVATITGTIEGGTNSVILQPSPNGANLTIQWSVTNSTFYIDGSL